VSAVPPEAWGSAPFPLKAQQQQPALRPFVRESRSATVPIGGEAPPPPPPPARGSLPVARRFHGSEEGTAPPALCPEPCPLPLTPEALGTQRRGSVEEVHVEWPAARGAAVAGSPAAFPGGTPRHATPMSRGQGQPRPMQGTPLRGVGAAMRDPRHSSALTPMQMGMRADGACSPPTEAVAAVALTPPGSSSCVQRWQMAPGAPIYQQQVRCISVHPVGSGGTSGPRTPVTCEGGPPQGQGAPADRTFAGYAGATSPMGAREASVSPMRGAGVATPQPPNGYAVAGVGRKSPRQAAPQLSQVHGVAPPGQGYPAQRQQQEAITPRMHQFPAATAALSRSPLRRQLPWGGGMVCPPVAGGSAGGVAFGGAVSPAPPFPSFGGVVVVGRKSPSPVRRVSRLSGSALLHSGVQAQQQADGQRAEQHSHGMHFEFRPDAMTPPPRMAPGTQPGAGAWAQGPAVSCTPQPSFCGEPTPPAPPPPPSMQPAMWQGRGPASGGQQPGARGAVAGSTSIASSGAKRAPTSGGMQPGSRQPQRSPSRARPGPARPMEQLSGQGARRPQEGSANIASSTASQQSCPSQPPGMAAAMPSRSASITSSNTSFYFTPQHSLAGAASGGGCGGILPATSYAPDPTDHIDHMFAAALASLDPSSASKLMVRRLAGWKYEIDGRRVTCRWGDTGGGAQGLVVSEDEVRDSELPLAAYLSQAANVAASLTGHRADMPKIARIPKEQRLTFADAATKGSTQALKLDDLGGERCESMRIACEQAFLREQAAEAYERSLRNPFALSSHSGQSRAHPPSRT